MFAALFSNIALTGADAPAQSLPADAADTLGQASLPGVGNLASSLKGKFKGKNNYFTTPRIKVGKVTGIFALYKPAGSRKFIFAAILGKTSLASLGVNTGPLDQVGIGSAVAVFSPDALGEKDVKKWPGTLGRTLTALTPSATNTKLKIGKSLNVFLRLADGKSGEFPALIKKIGLKLKNLTATVEFAKLGRKWVPSVTIMHWGAWKDPFAFRV
jgi:hypothetical protein